MVLSQQPVNHVFTQSESPLVCLLVSLFWLIDIEPLYLQQRFRSNQIGLYRVYQQLLWEVFVRTHTHTQTWQKKKDDRNTRLQLLVLYEKSSSPPPKSPCPFFSPPQLPPTCGSTRRENNRLLKLPIWPLTTVLTHQLGCRHNHSRLLPRLPAGLAALKESTVGPPEGIYFTSDGRALRLHYANITCYFSSAYRIYPLSPKYLSRC